MLGQLRRLEKEVIDSVLPELEGTENISEVHPEAGEFGVDKYRCPASGNCCHISSVKEPLYC